MDLIQWLKRELPKRGLVAARTKRNGDEGCGDEGKDCVEEPVSSGGH
jgi:hypothetical protein